MITRRIPLLCLLAIGLTAGCSSTPRTPIAIDEEQAIRDAVREAAPLSQGMRLSATMDNAASRVDVPRKLYSFVAEDLPLARACKLFGQTYSLNMVVDADVSGSVSVDLHNLPFDDIMESLLSANGYYWEKRGNVVYVKAWQTRSFSVDYIRLVRSGSGSSQAQVSSNAGGATGGGNAGGGGVGTDAAGATAGAMTIQQTDKVDFWTELEEQLQQLVSEEGRMVINRLAGKVQITDR
ncbi:MAG: secretin N-terminal domain-containing protein, partial [Gammaproteobacteria bacterium]